jgi:two-component system sensor histidine kinase RegB
MTPAREPRHGIDLSWLLTLRWGALAGQLATILAVDRIMGIDLPLGPLAVVLAIGAGSNVALGAWRRRAEVDDAMLAAVMLLDVALLTAVLYYTGGPFNPFSFLYLVNVALAAVILPPGWTWTLAGISLTLFGGLFFAHVPLPLGAGGGMDHAAMGHEMGDDHPISMHVQGMWVAFGVAAAFIVYFIQRVRRALAERDAELGAVRSAAARHEKLASLATLAAGAAHELATPLSTIAVVAKELERALGTDGADASTVADARLIREQVERCRTILVQMAADAGESTGEAPAAITVAAWFAAATEGLADRTRIVAAPGFAPAAEAATVRVPPRALAQALRGVLKNALEASAGRGDVRVELATAADRWRLAVADRGAGMTPEVLARAGEPFFTTKSTDGLARGMGLGLFLARVVLERLGGELEIRSTLGRGTTVTLIVPAADAATIGRTDDAHPARDDAQPADAHSRRARIVRAAS